MDLDEAVASLEGTIGNTIAHLAEECGVSEEALMLAAEEQDVFECSVCGWWCQAETFNEYGEALCWECDREEE